MDYEALRALIAEAGATGTDHQIADHLNALVETRPVSRFVNLRTMLSDMGPETTLTIKAKLEAAATSNALIALILPMLAPEAGGLDLGHPVTRQQIVALADAGLFTATERDGLIALAVETVRTVDARGLGTVYEGHVAMALAGGA